MPSGKAMPKKAMFGKKKDRKNVSVNKKQVHSPYLNKKFISSMLIVALGISMIPIGYFLSSETHQEIKTFQPNTDFSRILLEVKGNLEEEFSEILEDMINNPLNGLIPDDMPTSEEIFLSEWANDWFPEVQTPLIGNLIESIGAEMVGDINLDGIDPISDLNISTHLKPSGLSHQQCKELWNANHTHSLVSPTPTIWFSLAEGILTYREVIKLTFNLSNVQLDLINDWVNVSMNGWIKNVAEEIKITFELNPIIFFGLIIAGLALIAVGSSFIYSALRKRQRIDNNGIKSDKSLLSSKQKKKSSSGENKVN